MSAVLSIEGLCAFYGSIQALFGVDLALNKGSVTVLLGANGAGKTTTLRAICNMVRSSGAIRLEGELLSAKTTAGIVRRGIAHVPQGRGTFTNLTVQENLQLGAISRPAGAQIRTDIERMYSYFPILRQRRNQQAGTLSGGEQQMLAVARALMLGPRLMLLDEPSFGLAPMVVQELFSILERISREGMSLLIVEQNAQLALKIASHAYVIETGRIVMSGTAPEIAANDEIRNSYLGY